MQKLDKFIGKVLNTHQALVAQCIISKSDDDDYNEAKFEDDPEDDWPADYDIIASVFDTDIKCFREIILGKDNQFKVSPQRDAVITLSKYNQLLASLYKDYAHDLKDLRFELATFIDSYNNMKRKHYKTYRAVYYARVRIMDNIKTFDFTSKDGISDYQPKMITKCLKNLNNTLIRKKAMNKKSYLTANDINPYVKQLTQIIHKLLIKCNLF